MKLFGYELRRAEQRTASIENPTVPVSAENFLRFFGVGSIDIGPITVENAMRSPPVFAAVHFLSRMLASLPLHASRNTAEGPQRIVGGLETIVNKAPNPEWTSFGARAYFWRQLFQRGRGLIWIERGLNGQPAGLWPVNVARATVAMEGGRRSYHLDGKRYAASEIIDVPFALKDDQCGVVSPIGQCSGAIGLALEMEAYARKFFAGGGVPPLALMGPMPEGADGLKRAMSQVHRAIEGAQQSDKPIFPMPPGHKLEQVGFDPEKGQMTDARRFQLEEVARVFGLPPVFLQDLTHGTMTNTTQQDIFLVKHLVLHWVGALEQEMNLKLFGQMNARRYVEHNIDGVQRGEFEKRMEGMAKAIQNAILTPNEARALENRPAKPNGDDLMMQGATVPIGTQPNLAPATTNGEGNEPEE